MRAASSIIFTLRLQGREGFTNFERVVILIQFFPDIVTTDMMFYCDRISIHLLITVTICYFDPFAIRSFLGLKTVIK